ncbi:MAG: hypothetical protein MJZ82_02235 [Paludibacteraceae bacterium]|nr:hypothetical protein [Paludibacteraceae bacterium]
MKRYFFFITLCVLLMVGFSCKHAAQSDGNTPVSDSTFTVMSPEEAEAFEFLFDFYDHWLGHNFPNQPDVNPNDYITERLADYSCDADWDIFIGAQDVPERFQINIRFFPEYENAYEVIIDDQKHEWFHTDLVCLLVHQTNGYKIDNILYLNNGERQWLADYSRKPSQYSETLFITPSQRSVECTIENLMNGNELRLRDEHSSGESADALILRREGDNDLCLWLRHNHCFIGLTRFPEIAAEPSALDNIVQLSLCDVTGDGVGEYLVAFGREGMSSRFYIYKLRVSKESLFAEPIVENVSIPSQYNVTPQSFKGLLGEDVVY